MSQDETKEQKESKDLIEIMKSGPGSEFSKADLIRRLNKKRYTHMEAYAIIDRAFLAGVIRRKSIGESQKRFRYFL